MPLPIVLDATPLGGGHGARGIGAYVRGLLQGFAALPHESRPQLLLRQANVPKPDGFFALSLTGRDWRVRHIADPRPILWQGREARRLLGANAIHLTTADLAPPGRVVASCHDLIPALMHEDYLGPVRHRLYGRYLAALRRSEIVLAPSQATATDLVRVGRVDANRIRIVPYAVPAAAPSEGSVPDVPFVLYSGGVEPHKNAGLALGAIAAAESRPHLVVTGPWSSRRAARLRSEAVALRVADRVEWAGYVPPGRLTALRQAALAVVVPSRAEGFGFPVLEAMAVGTPVLAADIPVLREVSGGGAELLPLDDPSAWGRALDALAGSGALRAERGRVGRARAGEFSWERVAVETLACYHELLS
ncbi:MAG: glycosyltransferase family 4 protein [Actinobacteria bacterium]|nr:glycosyltransferase family 4 protein [Actinomycetota bacterium]